MSADAFSNNYLALNRDLDILDAPMSSGGRHYTRDMVDETFSRYEGVPYQSLAHPLSIDQPDLSEQDRMSTEEQMYAFFGGSFLKMVFELFRGCISGHV
ncbi:hypothetical protein GNI_072550 [Gregarina niphandrodes]|uniref:Uncharacterized protein n=1 Tax=Gregarina niphandrodes TaxID=110365 RepID=A0A023B7A9_GRENI|nr:hypothetical protein GNI_072550 [Gregarina niphandrodes]EZG67034.1 hypothetical protein GNI_072550 [Gregarina niphandrodes]|eukprot:XP_011130361.1 hypothetical protein GNI_072550 [Gregarina niphandrodes]